MHYLIEIKFPPSRYGLGIFILLKLFTEFLLHKKTWRNAKPFRLENSVFRKALNAQKTITFLFFLYDLFAFFKHDFLTKDKPTL